MSDLGRHTATRSILDIPVSVTGVSVFTDPTATAILPLITAESGWTGPEIPEPIPHHLLVAPAAAPSFDWSQHDNVNYNLQVRLTDLEAWLSLREKYGSINLLIGKVNTDLIILGHAEQQFEDVEEF